MVTWRGPRLRSPHKAFPGMQAPQLWQGIAEHLAKSSPEVLVLIHPIHMTPTSHSQRAISVGPPVNIRMEGPTGLLSLRCAAIMQGILLGTSKACHFPAAVHGP